MTVPAAWEALPSVLSSARSAHANSVAKMASPTMITIRPGPGSASKGDAGTDHRETERRDEHPLGVAPHPRENDDRPAQAEPVPERRRSDRRELVVADLGRSLLAQ